MTCRGSKSCPGAENAVGDTADVTASAVARPSCPPLMYMYDVKVTCPLLLQSRNLYTLTQLGFMGLQLHSKVWESLVEGKLAKWVRYRTDVRCDTI